MVAINRAMQPYYGSLFGDPETSIATLASAVVQPLGDASGVQYTSQLAPFLNYFAMRTLASASYAGLVVYKIYPVAWPQQYVESVYLAFARKSPDWQSRIRVAAGVMVSIRCVTQFQVTPQTSTHPNHPAKPQAAGCGAGGPLRGYQKELGTQWVHDSLGTNYLEDIGSADWKDAGRDGPGYYKKVSGGNFEEKLQFGRDDDC